MRRGIIGAMTILRPAALATLILTADLSTRHMKQSMVASLGFDRVGYSLLNEPITA